jgi:competence protein ComEA
MKRFLSSYFSFTKKERTGTIVLVILIAFFLALPFFYPLFIKQKTYDHSQFQKEIASLQPAHKDSSSFQKDDSYNDDDKYNTSYYNEPSERKTNDEIKGELFYFDPNTLNEDGWKRLGVKDKTIQTIQKYLSRGGRFKNPEDISKIWGLSPTLVQRLTPYVKIENTNVLNQNQSYQPTYEKKEYKKEIIPIDINTADTTAFIALPGIGSKLANRIVTFRNKLGGFYKIDQLAETWGLPDSTFQLIKPGLILNDPAIKQININSATLDELKAHPYIRYYVANAIVQYRAQHGNFSSVNDIKNIKLVTDSIFQKAAPYLKVN